MTRCPLGNGARVPALASARARSEGLGISAERPPEAVITAVPAAYAASIARNWMPRLRSDAATATVPAKNTSGADVTEGAEADEDIPALTKLPRLDNKSLRKNLIPVLENLIT
ncbi:hypothetical protein FANTH_14420 [Fusarium anthophilum]|uniref:Uncharacterized protein n=1 Tax=Fusarium anthophilum TaxID=48485 RepID=A0A8H5DMK9_9HYPO|nr:hypothetical protein FANTH_14420 [Fusarium anthophilum]